jgi:hypothetical protein
MESSIESENAETSMNRSGGETAETSMNRSGGETANTSTNRSRSLFVMHMLHNFGVSETEVKEKESDLSRESDFNRTFRVSYDELNDPHEQKHLRVNNTEIIEEDFTMFGQYETVNKWNQEDLQEIIEEWAGTRVGVSMIFENHEGEREVKKMRIGSAL